MNQAKAGVSEAQVHRCVFLALGPEAEDGKVRAHERESLDHLHAAVESLRQRLAAHGGADVAFAPVPAVIADDGERSTTQLLYPAEGSPLWVHAAETDPPGAALGGFVHARASHHVLLLHVAAAQGGPADSAAWDRLKETLWSPEAELREARYFLGEVVCYAARVGGKADARRAAREALYGPGAGVRNLLRFARLPFGGWLYCRPGETDELALFYPNRNEPEASAAEFLTNVLPFLALYAKKIARQYQGAYEGPGGLRHKLEAEERVLEDLLKTQERAPAPARQEERLRAVEAAYGAFAAELSRFKKIQQSVGLNRAHLEEVLARHGLPPAGPLAALRATAASAVAQMEADDKLHRAVVATTEMTLRAMQLRVDIGLPREQAQTTRPEAEPKTGPRTFLLLFLGTLLGTSLLITEAVADACDRWVVLWLRHATFRPDLYPLTVFLTRLALVAAVSVPVAWLVWDNFLRGKKKDGHQPIGSDKSGLA